MTESTTLDGSSLGGFVLEELLGEGASGRVYRARAADGALVAVKVLRHTLGAGTALARFRREARIAAEIRHPGIVTVIAEGEEDGRHYIVTEYLADGSLDRLLAVGPMPRSEMGTVGRDLGAALDAVHARNAVHRDVKPSNILQRSPGYALCDLGLARYVEGTQLTGADAVLGTLDYLAPEMISGGAVGPPADVYALGCVLFECATGAPPFAGSGAFEVALAHLERRPPDVRSLDPTLPAGIAAAIAAALEKEPERRPASAGLLGRLLTLGADGG